MSQTIKHWIIISSARLFAFLFGDKIILLNIEDAEGGYAYVRSPDLPGFAMVLQPGERNSVKSLIGAISDPLTAYLEAEARRLASINDGNTARRPTLTGWAQAGAKLIAAASCP